MRELLFSPEEVEMTLYLTQVQENQKKAIKIKKIRGATFEIKLQEILSLLSKTSQDFKKESELTENVSYLFNKKTPKDMA